jgi:hypothetical protein
MLVVAPKGMQEGTARTESAFEDMCEPKDMSEPKDMY